MMFFCNLVFIWVNIDLGLSGIGEVGLVYGVGVKVGVGIIRDLVLLIVGEDLLNIEKIWEFFFRKIFWGMGGGNVFYVGMSVIDIVFWDIKGKYLGVFVY